MTTSPSSFVVARVNDIDGTFERALAKVTSSKWVMVDNVRFGVVFRVSRGSLQFFLCESVSASGAELSCVNLGGDGGPRVIVKQPAILVKSDDSGPTCMAETFDADMSHLCNALCSPDDATANDDLTPHNENVLRASAASNVAGFLVRDGLRGGELEDDGDGDVDDDDDDRGGNNHDDDIFAVFEDNDSCGDEDSDLDDETDEDDAHEDGDLCEDDEVALSGMDDDAVEAAGGMD